MVTTKKNILLGKRKCTAGNCTEQSSSKTIKPKRSPSKQSKLFLNLAYILRKKEAMTISFYTPNVCPSMTEAVIELEIFGALRKVKIHPNADIQENDMLKIKFSQTTQNINLFNCTRNAVIASLHIASNFIKLN